MRSKANFALHAALAALLAALAAGSAAAVGTGSYLQLDPPKGEGAAGGGPQLAVKGFHWGPRQTTSADGSRSRTGNQVSLDDKAEAAHDPKPPRDASLGSASERRQHAPVTFPTPHDRGSLTVHGSLPDCAVGKRYAGAQFAAGAMRYELKDVIISNCAADSVSLDYAKVTVRGWNPEKKESVVGELR